MKAQIVTNAFATKSFRLHVASYPNFFLTFQILSKQKKFHMSFTEHAYTIRKALSVSLMQLLEVRSAMSNSQALLPHLELLHPQSQPPTDKRYLARTKAKYYCCAFSSTEHHSILSQHKLTEPRNSSVINSALKLTIIHFLDPILQHRN